MRAAGNRDPNRRNGIAWKIAQAVAQGALSFLNTLSSGKRHRDETPSLADHGDVVAINPV